MSHLPHKTSQWFVVTPQCVLRERAEALTTNLAFAMALICTSALAVPMPFATPSRPGPSAAEFQTRLTAAKAAHAATVFPDQARFPGDAGFVVTPSGVSEAAGSAKALTQDDGYVLVTPRKGGKGERAVDMGRVHYTYDKMGRRISMTAAALAGTVTYRYDAVGRLIGLTDHKGRLYGFAYDDADRRTRLTRPNGVTTEYAYDLAGQLAGIRHLRNGTAIEMAGYVYDGRGLPTKLTDTAGTRAFTYDDTGQLLSATDPMLGAETFAYDALGNHLGKGRTYDPANRLLDDADTTYDYDANGSLLAREPKAGGAGTGYEWDGDGRLSAVTLPGGERVSFAYRVDGPRTAVTTPAGTTRYVYDGEDIIATLDAAGNVLATFTHGPGIDEPLAIHTAAGSYEYLADGLGSIQALTDDTGATVESYRYTAFGQTSIADAAGAPLVASALGNPYGFTAREMGSLPGVPYFYRARYYEPELGRWVSEDPIGLMGGVNVCAYVQNTPSSTIDPWGLEGCANQGCIGHSRDAMGVPCDVRPEDVGTPVRDPYFTPACNPGQTPVWFAHSYRDPKNKSYNEPNEDGLVSRWDYSWSDDGVTYHSGGANLVDRNGKFHGQKPQDVYTTIPNNEPPLWTVWPTDHYTYCRDR